MAPDESSSSPTLPSTEKESQTHRLSSSQFQLPSFPRMLLPQPPPPPSTANFISGWIRTMPRSRKTMAPDDSSSASTEGESQTHQSSSSQFQLPYFPRMLLLQPPPPPQPPSTANSIPGWKTTMLRSRKPMAMAATSHILQPDQDSPLPASTPNLKIIKELFSGMDPVSAFLPDHVPRTSTQPLLQFAENISDCVTSESVCSNDEVSGPAINNVIQKIQKRVIFSRVLPGDDDPGCGIWVAPPRGYFKLNVAVTRCYVEETHMFGMGAVIRDHSGAARGALTLLFSDIAEAHAESFIYNLGIAFSLYWGFKWLIAETESHYLVEQFRVLADTPRLHFQNFNYFYAKQVSREANGAARVFAECAQLQRRRIFWTVGDIRTYFGSNVMRF